MFDLILRHETHKLARYYYFNESSVIRPIRYVRYTSVKDWIGQDYYLTGEQCLDLLELESSRFISYCYDFFQAGWPRESNVINTTFHRLKDHAFNVFLTTPVDRLAMTPKEVAAEYGAWLAHVRAGGFEETELLLYNEWLSARQKGFADLKLPALFQPTKPKNSSAS